MMLRSLIIDDEPLAHKVILEYAKDIPFLEVSAQSHLALEALDILRTQPIDLIFLDIQMPRIKGLDFLRTLPKRPVVIITSAYEEYALESFELDVCDYLLKPFRFERFLKAVNKARQLTTTRESPLPAADASSGPEHMFIKVDKRLVNISLEQVSFLESYGNYVKVWMGDFFHLTPRTLASFARELPATDFFRIHKSFVVNRAHIDYVEGNFVLMKNTRQLPIGKSQRTAFRQFIAG